MVIHQNFIGGELFAPIRQDCKQPNHPNIKQGQLLTSRNNAWNMEPQVVAHHVHSCR